MTKRQIDWEKIELDYRAGIKTLRQIADEHGISNPAILKRAKRDDWVRDLSARIDKKANELVIKDLVSANNDLVSKNQKLLTKNRKLQENQLIEANAQAIAEIRLSHRKDFQRFKKTVNDLQQELDELNALKDPDNLVLRTKVLKDLTDTHAKLVSLKRQAYNMDKETVQTIDPLQELIGAINGGSSFGVVRHDPDISQ